MPVSIREFTEYVCASGLMTQEQLDAFRGSLPESSRDGKVSTLVRELVSSRKLTAFQAKRIVEGDPYGLILGNNVLEERIGAGGMGEVFKARHRRMNRIVAVKVLNSRSTSDYSLKRFQREMEAAAQLIHPNIVTAYDADDHDGTHFIVMEFVDGLDLSEMITNDGPLNLPKAANLISQAAKGLHYAHSKGIVHRDIKPGNILVDKTGQVKILDMGLARFSDPIDAEGRTSDSGLTRDNQIVGTVDFMAPEQADDSKSVECATDIYSLGCTLYFLLTGTPPYFRSSLVKTLIAHRVEEVPQITSVRPDLSPKIDQVLQKMMAKNPADRYSSMADVIRHLRVFEDTETDFRLVDPYAEGDGQGDDETRIFDPADIASALEARDRGDTLISERSPGNSVTTTLDRNTTLDGARAEELDPKRRKQSARPAIGIDIGTMNTKVAMVDDSGMPISLSNEEGEYETFTALLFEPEEVVVGKEAIRAEITNRDMVARNSKLELGQRLYRKKFGSAEYPPEALLAWVLNKVKTDSREAMGDSSHAVFSVPAKFDEVQRRALLDAGYIAGMDVVDLITEPLATAITYCHQNDLFCRSADSGSGETGNRVERFLVCDLGEGMLDISIIEFDGRQLKTVAVGGDSHFGGRDWKHRLVGFVNDCFRKRNGLNPLAEQNSVGRISRECEESKQVLSSAAKTFVNIDYKGLSDRYEITRELFEEITDELIARCQKHIEETLASASLSWTSIDRILLAGGASKMPQVATMFERISGKKIDDDWMMATDSVAHGAALYAELLQARDMGLAARFEIVDVNCRSLGVVGVNPQTKKNQTAFLIRRNTPLPAVATRTFRTTKKNQNSIVIQIIEGESRRPEECHKIGNCVVRNLPPDLPARTPIEVRFTYEHNGLLNVSLKIDDKERVQKITRRNEMTVEQLDEWKLIVSDDEFDEDLDDDLFGVVPEENSNG